MRLDNYPMKQNGMYILKKTDFDDIAEMVLKEYMPFVLNEPKAVDIEYLAEECLYLDIKHDNIVPEGKILGLVAFSDTEFKTIGIDDNERVIELDEGTILIDYSLIGTENRPRKRFTEAHETSHWICHRSFHSPTNRQYEFRVNGNFIACRTDNIEQYKRKKGYSFSDEDWEEWQADSLAASLLMPKAMFVEACRDEFHHERIWKGYLTPGTDDFVAKKIIAKMARLFDVSYRAAQIRMINLGLIRFSNY